YSLLQKVDTYGFNQLWVEKSSDSKLGIAINDRLMRAASDI
ncbi:MAG TPA: translation factor Sua5, partial [Opitutae bacterium]|nr:translation factor Sua5 [Opitutae bacterium]